jgi:hypothetical protein
MKVIKATVVLLAALASGAAFADCDKAALKERPDVPDGGVATMEQMLDAREAVATYVSAAEAYLQCVEPVPFQHNYIVSRVESVAAVFNEERQRFLQREEAVAAN